MSKFRISGLQKLTLLDFPGHVACTVFTEGCNFRCPFCHNASLVTHTEDNVRIDEEEILKFLSSRQGILDGACITGGEPTLVPTLYDFIAEVKKLGFKVKLDTNGTNPKVLKRLVTDGLVDYVAMDIKNSKEKYALTAGISDGYDLSKIEESVEYLKSGVVSYEFRTTVVDPLHDAADFVSIGEWIAGAEKYFLQKFVDSGDIIGSGFEPYSDQKMHEFLEAVKTFVPNAQLRGV